MSYFIHKQSSFFFNRTKSLLSFGHIFSSSSILYLLKSSLLFIPILNASIHRKSSNLTPCSRSFSSSTLRSFMPYSSQIWYNSCSVACPILRNFIKYSFGYSLTPSNDSNPFLLRTFRNLLDIFSTFSIELKNPVLSAYDNIGFYSFCCISCNACIYDNALSLLFAFRFLEICKK